MSDTPPSGRLFGHYEILGLIGRGGMGEVYRVRDTRKGRVVALKLLPKAFTDDPAFRARFEREAHIAATVNDPHIVPIHDYGEIDGVLFIEMAFIDGTDLRTKIRQHGPLDPAHALALIESIGSAVDTAHQQGLLHRDIKPENILVTAKGFPYLTDFGIAAQQDGTRLTNTGSAVGSLSYMAPERFDGVALSSAIDEYALGCVLFECLSGNPPFGRDSASATMRGHLLSEPPSLQTTGVPPEVDSVIQRALAKSPEQRYPTCAGLAAAFRDSLSGRGADDATVLTPWAPTGMSDLRSQDTVGVTIPGGAGRPTHTAPGEGIPAQAPPPGKRGIGIAAGVAAVVAVVVIVAAVLFLSRGGSPRAAGDPTSTSHAAAVASTPTRPSTASSTSTAPSATSTTPSAPNPAPTVTFPSTSRPSCMTAGYKKRIPITDPGIRTLIGHNTTCGYAERVASAARAYLYRNPSSSSFDVTAYSSAYNMTRTLHCVFNGSYATCTNVGGTEKVFVAPDGATS